MKMLHLADLHLGKRISGFSMQEDQEHILRRILEITDAEKPDAILIAGDIYDKLTPPAEAVQLLDWFLNELTARRIETFLIAGNHDSAERIAFGGRIMDRSGIHFSAVYDGRPQRFTLSDAHGEADVYLLPYLRAAEVRRFFPDAVITDTAGAVRTAIAALPLDRSRRSIILSHQFVMGGVTCDSERNAVGGTDSVPPEVYADFDYAALGHLHGPQQIGSPAVRYSGSPLKYSFSEAAQKKSVTVCELGEKGTAPEIRCIPLTPLRDMRILTGDFETVMQDASEDYLHIRLTDTSRIPDAIKKLRTKYPQVMSIEYIAETERTPHQIAEKTVEFVREDPLTMFTGFFRDMNGREMSDSQADTMRDLINEIWAEEGKA